MSKIIPFTGGTTFFITFISTKVSLFDRFVLLFKDEAIRFVSSIDQFWFGITADSCSLSNCFSKLTRYSRCNFSSSFVLFKYSSSMWFRCKWTAVDVAGFGAWEVAGEICFGVAIGCFFCLNLIIYLLVRLLKIVKFINDCKFYKNIVKMIE